MAEPTPEGADGATPKKKSKLPLILGVVLAIAGGGGGFMAVQMGLIGGGDHAAPDEHATADAGADLPDLGNPHFIPLEPIVVNLPAGSGSNFLRLSAQLDVPEAYVSEVQTVAPRIVDVLNGYLRAVDIADLQDRTALARLRSQMLRRVQVVTGEGRVRDILISEFVLN